MPERRRALLVDAFTDEPLAGNVAGVVPDAEGLTEGQMRKVARELGAAETAFVLPSGTADRRLRFFTPTTEVDLCGHATVATGAALHADGTVGSGTHAVETAAGTVEVAVEDGVVWLTPDAPEVRPADADYGRIADALGVERAALEELRGELPVAVATAGVAYLVVPVAFLEQLGAAAPDDDAVEAVCADAGATGLYAFTFDTVGPHTLHGRMFAPAAGIPEDPVTGTASAAVAAYLRRHGAFAGGGAGDLDVEGGDGMPAELVFEQGHFVDRPGHVRVRAREAIQVGGRATVALDGELAIPPAEDEDILEV